jgi:phosphomannomutase
MCRNQQNILAYMDITIQTVLDTALAEKRLNKVAYDEIIKWLTGVEFQEFVPELQKQISAGDWDMLMDKFYRVLIFGTGGIRGKMDIGTNRMNAYMIRWASQAYAEYLKKYKPELVDNGVAIAYDSRNNSQRFMEETARVLAGNGIKTYVFRDCRATPELSFTVRHLNLAGGIVVTASHNPPEFNGYKVYAETGVQVLEQAGREIEKEFQTVVKINKMTFSEAVEAGKVIYISEEVDRAFAESAKKVSVYAGRDVKIVYSPLHGVGSESVLPVLRNLGFEDVQVVDSQMSIDGNFPNVEGHFPNPEFDVVYKESIALAKTTHADIVIVSDPDADRLGIAIPKDQDWWVLNGNQTAALLGYFYLKTLSEKGGMPARPVIIKTTVTTELLRDIGESFGVEVIGDLLVGFKYIGDRQEHLAADQTYLMACEESCGYNFSNDYRDKGAETPAIVAAELGAWCKANNRSISDLLEEVYQKYGYYAERLYYRLIEGFGSFEQMNLAMAEIRKNLPKEIAGRKVVKVIDRLTGEVKDAQIGAVLETRNWDKGDMLSFFFSDDERNVIHVRPSGTEPKMKYYTAMKGQLTEKTKADIEAEAEAVEQDMVKLFENILSTIKVEVF